MVRAPSNEPVVRSYSSGNPHPGCMVSVMLRCVGHTQCYESAGSAWPPEPGGDAEGLLV